MTPAEGLDTLSIDCDFFLAASLFLVESQDALSRIHEIDVMVSQERKREREREREREEEA
jgi:hypothetical protein